MTFVPAVYKIRQGGVWVRGVPKKKVGGSFEPIAGPKVKQAPSFPSFVAFSTSFEEAGTSSTTTDLTGNHTITFGNGAVRDSSPAAIGTRSLNTSASFSAGFAQAATSTDFDLEPNQNHTLSAYINVFFETPFRILSNGVWELRYVPDSLGGQAVIEFEVPTDSGTVVLQSTTPVQQGGSSTYHILVIFDADNGLIKLGYEGNIEDSQAWDGTIAGTSGPLLVGGDGWVYIDAPEVIQGWAYTQSSTTYTVPTQLLKDVFDSS